MYKCVFAGEGTDKNVTRAEELYSEAASKGSVRALNGHGFIYFYGTDGVLKNESKAYALFKTAADMKIDGDSSFNTGFCLHHGIGVEKDLQLAHYYYNIAAQNFGHFDSIRALGTMYYNGLGVVRSPEYALTYFAATLNIGPWNGWLRKGLDRYLDGDYVTALACYAFAAELGMYIIMYVCYIHLC